ncbi:MAG: hypothetical protein LBO77_03585 [Desulfovibrio sp.]|jgi:hypothetical protein|nr:hypothetical protein [Desulfovibrio sp.]
MSQEKHPQRIRYEYEQSPDARLLYAHGVIGGINSQGEVEMNFYIESDRLPAFSECLVAPDGSFGHEITPADEEVKHVARFIHSKIVLNYYAARDLAEWLEEQITVMEGDGRNQMYFDDEEGNLPH